MQYNIGIDVSLCVNISVGNGFIYNSCGIDVSLCVNISVGDGFIYNSCGVLKWGTGAFFI